MLHNRRTYIVKEIICRFQRQQRIVVALKKMLAKLKIKYLVLKVSN